ncbi:hypothetical protein SCHPADRAFT_916979 [Schizopora paradoxa]|uniref:Uncharacterized protein n=1 Tax=Schizopora paradoxa TaxID=27342 RepID=A0A0H2RFE1_9AGAM|nr:hypothetical protein SCHPADRAFT_916979 [Schizopora paradoxa]
MSTSFEAKLALPAFLKMLTADKLPMPKAMAIAGNVYKTYNTPAALAGLTDGKLSALGVDAKEDRKMVLAAVKKAGYKVNVKDGAGNRRGVNAVAGPSTPKAKPNGTRKRKREEVLEDLLPEGPKDESALFGNFEFKEQFDEDVLRTKFVVINRAPAMTAWATVVAERLGFKREEALSIASAYTEMNAISKGVSLGIFEKGRADGVELAKGESQPYVDFMGRRPLYTSQPSGQWRALVKSEPVSPAAAFAYMTNAFRQTLPYVMGALRLLAGTFSPAWLNEHGFELYKDFRPEADRWGERAELRCARILGLRRKGGRSDGEGGEKGNITSEYEVKTGSSKDVDGESKKDPPVQESKDSKELEEAEPVAKRVKNMSVEEYEATLDDSDIYGAFWDEGL